MHLSPLTVSIRQFRSMNRAGRYALVVGPLLAIAAVVFLRPRPAHLAATARAGDDTVVINQTHPTRLRVSVIDQYGRRLGPDTAIRYRRIRGAPVNLSPTGSVTCERSEDAVVQATLSDLATELVLHCRPVVSVDAPTWMDFVVGDPPRTLAFTARGPDGRVVTELRGAVEMLNPSIADARGTPVRPTQAGQTAAAVEVGDTRTIIRIVVHQLVTSFVNNARNAPRMAMRVSLARGDTVEVPLPKAAFWAKYFASDGDSIPPTIEIRGKGSCTTGDGLRASRVEEGAYMKYCLTGDGATMRIAHGATGAPIVRGTVAIQLVW